MSQIGSARKHKEFASIEKEKKNFNQKIQLMNNRIKSIQQKQNEINLKISTMKNIEKHKESFQSFKEKNKSELIKSKKYSEKILQKKKEIVQKDKIQRSESLKKSRLINQQKKQRQFNESRTEQLFTKSMLSQYNTHKYNLNKCKVVKEKLNQVKYQTEKEKIKTKTHEKLIKVYQRKIDIEREETQKLKNKIEALEKFEEQCISRLNQTMMYKNEVKKNLSLHMNRVDILKKKNQKRSNSSCGDRFHRKNPLVFYSANERRRESSKNRSRLNHSMEEKKGDI